MKNKRRHAHRPIVTTLILILTLLLVAPGVTPVATAGAMPPAREAIGSDRPGAEVSPPAGLTSDDWATMQDLIRQAQYQFAWQEINGVGAYRAPNRANGLSLSLAADGMHAARYGADRELLWDFGISLTAYGEQAFPAAIAAGDLIGRRERVEYRWSEDVVEWYVNGAAGVEHGLTLAAPPAGVDGTTVGLAFALRGSLRPELDGDGETLCLKDAQGETVLRYDQLTVYDATGRALPASLSLSPGGESRGEGRTLHLTIDAADAVYPLTVDPLLHSQAAKLTASDTEDNDQFGWSVAISGDTVVVGADREDGVGTGDRGAAYVFTRNEGGSADGWGQVVKISAAPLQDGANFGFSVAISGDTVVVGAPNEDDVGVGDCVTGANCGAAYVFERNKNGTDMWGQVRRLTASYNAEIGGNFGYSVAISGDTLVVGTPGEDSTGGTNQGTAYIFERNRTGGDNWGQRKRLVAGTLQANASFGYAVAISGDQIVVGAYLEDAGGNDRGAAYVFARNEGGADSWGQVKRLTGPDPDDGDSFGNSVAIDGDVIVVGAYGEDGAGINRGAAYLFERNQGGADNWGQVKGLTASDAANGDHFGTSVAISGDTLVVGADKGDSVGGNDQGAAYVFERNDNGPDAWGQAAKLNASDAAPGDAFGYAVSISGDTVVVGAWGEDGAGGANPGAAYLFVGGESEWQEVANPHASDAGDGDRFGLAVAISGDTAVVGADLYEGSSGSDIGSAYVLERNQGGMDGWGQVKKLLAADGASEDYFGRSVAISGDTIVVGAWGENGAGTSRGAAYVFERNYDRLNPGVPQADNWGQVAKLTASDPGDQDYFGFAVGISDDIIVVGARGENRASPPALDRGAAYIFGRNQGGANNWGEVKKLLASDDEENDNFGYSVGISGDKVVVGAYSEDGAGTDRGAAYVFARNYNPNNPGTPWADNWGEVAKLEASYPEDSDRFGFSVAISNDTVVVGAYQEDGLGGDDLGAAYVFERNKNGADAWGLVKKLFASDAADNDYFGVSVAISGDTLVVGAHGENGFGFGVDDRGAAYIFERNQGGIAENWGEVTKLRASDAANNDFFGRAVAISGDQIVVGAYGEDGAGTDRGAAYVFCATAVVYVTYLPVVFNNR